MLVLSIPFVYFCLPDVCGLIKSTGLILEEIDFIFAMGEVKEHLKYPI